MPDFQMRNYKGEVWFESVTYMAQKWSFAVNNSKMADLVVDQGQAEMIRDFLVERGFEVFDLREEV